MKNFLNTVYKNIICMCKYETVDSVCITYNYHSQNLKDM